MSDSESSREDRQLPASERRLQQAREEGQVARSRDLAHLAAIGALITLLAGLGPWLSDQALELVGTGLRFDRKCAFDTACLAPRLAYLGLAGLTFITPVIAGMALLMTAANIAVGGWNVAPAALAPKFERLNPIAGLGRIFSWRQLLDHMRLILVAGALLACAWFYLKLHAQDLDMLARMPLGDALQSGFAWLSGGLFVLLGVAGAAALADVPLQIFKHNAGLRMTREEARQENRESDGDPHVKAQRRRMQREMSRGRMLSAVPTASVIVTNPTHYAVALFYDEATMAAPRIVAMGADHLALKIREVGTASRVPMLEAPPLARALYSNGKIGAEVPVELYTAVAQVLAWVMRLRTALRPPAAPAGIDIPAGMDPLDRQGAAA